jgi:hypothetical protein
MRCTEVLNLARLVLSGQEYRELERRIEPERRSARTARGQADKFR